MLKNVLMLRVAGALLLLSAVQSGGLFAAPAAAEDGRPSGAPAQGASVQAGEASNEQAKANAPGAIFDHRDADYYDKRAAEILKRDQQTFEARPHPLATAHPDKFVIVCEAGCRGGSGAEIVSLRPRPEKQDGQSAGQAAAGPDVISCVGGCGEGPSSYASVSSASKAIAETSIPEWSTSVARVPEGAEAPSPQVSSGSGSGDWMKRIDAERERSGKGLPTEDATAEVSVQAPDAGAKTDAASQAPEAARELQVAATAETSKAEPDKAVKETAPAAVAPGAEPGQNARAPQSAEGLADAMATAEPLAEAPTITVEGENVPSAARADEPVELAAVTPPPQPNGGAPSGGDHVVSILSDDAQMNEAIAKARAGLASFWHSLENPGPGESDFAVKVAISGDGATEHFWLTEIRRVDDKFRGLISNEPQTVKSVRLGQPYTFSESEISDWTFKRNGKLVGNETMRVLLPRMPAEQAAFYRNLYESP